MTDTVEILAMNLWMQVFGVTAIRPDWTEWAASHPTEAQVLRDKAAQMIEVAKANNTHSLGWLM